MSHPLSLLAALALCAVLPSGSQAAPDQRWDASFAAFDADDRAHAPPAGGVLFVGSSSIRLWDGLETQFDALPVVVKRGFGGSSMADCAQHLDRLVTRYRPREVIVYAGDNDLAEGRSPAQVLESFQVFVDGVHRELPQTRIDYLSIKPSPLRAPLLARIRETNALIRDYVAQHARLGFIDIFTPMLGPDGAPRRELFRADALHLNDAGYALWRRVISERVK
jgi:lysophospholipase L1-like esterase